ncbi:US12 family protein [Candidatus Uhrbacteria bacterium]|nr:US12 family protein [Candidatus Uhrbacteria bacterium]
MSKQQFALLVSFWTAVGIGGSAVGAYASRDWQFGLGLLLIPFVMSIVGTMIALRSNEPIISLLGYALVAIPFGFMLGPVVAMYTVASVLKVFAVTTMITIVFGVVGAVIPDSLEGWGSALFGCLLILIIGGFAVPIAGLFGLPITTALSVLDWCGVIVFTGLVIFDWNRAMRVERTHDNAIDCALAIYLDWVNLFIRLLSIMGTRTSSSDD